MRPPITNLRIRFYGVRGSGSTFPAGHETDALQDLMDYELLHRVFDDVARHIGPANQLDRSVLEIIGGPINRSTLLKYRDTLHIPKPRIYGGWTTCVWIETADGHDIVIDCGSGFRNCAKDLHSKWNDHGRRQLSIFGSHSHSDHTEGFDQAAVCFHPKNTIQIYANYQYLYALDSYLGIFSHFVEDDVLGVQTPINYSIMPAQFEAIELRDLSEPPIRNMKESMKRRIHDLREPLEIGATTVTPFEVYHPAPCLAYTIEHGGRKFVFCTDHELRRGADPEDPRQKASEQAEERLKEQARDADLLYRDGQYLRSDYDGLTGIGSSGPISRLDWGHSCIEDVQDMALECGVKCTFIGHHDPNREWAESNWIDEALARTCQGRKEKVELARAETIVDL